MANISNIEYQDREWAGLWEFGVYANLSLTAQQTAPGSGWEWCGDGGNVPKYWEEEDETVFVVFNPNLMRIGRTMNSKVWWHKFTVLKPAEAVARIILGIKVDLEQVGKPLPQEEANP